MTQPTFAETVLRETELELVVDEVRAEARDVVSLRLVAPDGRELPPWTPGAHVDLILRDDLVRQYSLCGGLDDRGAWRVAVLQAPESRGGSEFVHERLAKGTVVRVRGPRNHFALVRSPRYLFLAGGIGVTPILPMVAQAEAAGADWRLHYGGRTRDSMAFAEELERYGDRVTLVPQDEAGLPDLDALLDRPEPGTLVYCCGPEPLLRAVEERCARWPAGTLHLERFGARAGEPAAGDTAFDVVLQRSGLTLTVPPGTSVFDAVRGAGVSVLGSCLEGICGTCETEVVEGEVDHRDSVLTAEERESGEVMMICVSRCRSGRLVLDL
jgi:ferredoxin-NADP reductase